MIFALLTSRLQSGRDRHSPACAPGAGIRSVARLASEMHESSPAAYDGRESCPCEFPHCSNLRTAFGVAMLLCSCALAGLRHRSVASRHEFAGLCRDEYSEFLFRDAGADTVSGDAGVDARVVGRGGLTRYPGDFRSGVCRAVASLGAEAHGGDGAAGASAQCWLAGWMWIRWWTLTSLTS